ncbi:MAG: 3-keto-disaccharide hydrolase [Phycisphaeraceae bacterium]
MFHPSIKLIALVALLALAGWGASRSIAEEPTEDPAEDSASDEDGWEILFDGSNTDALRDFRGDAFPEKGWSIQDDGSLYAKHGSRDIVTRKRYSDFDLRLEWKLSKGANSGILYRVAQRGHHPHDTGPEYQIIDDPRIHKYSTGSLYDMIAPNDKATINPAGEWNNSRLVIQDNLVKHYLNDELVVEYVWGSDEIKAKLSKSKFRNWKGYMQEDAGYIGFQSHGNDLWLRDIRIKDLSSD